MKGSIAQEIVKEVDVLPDALQRQVLAYVKTLRAPEQRGTPGKRLLQFAGAIPVRDLESMRQAIESAV